MRLIATEPDFTWSGTGFILGAFTLASLGIGAAAAARHGGRSRRWRLTVLLAIPLFLSPGMILVPALVVGGWGIRRGRRARAAAAAGVLVGPLFLVQSAWEEVQRTLMPYPDAVYLAILGLGATLLAATLAWAASAALGPWAPRRASPRGTTGDGPPPMGADRRLLVRCATRPPSAHCVSFDRDGSLA